MISTFTPPDPDFLSIARLFLEKYELLETEDRKLYRKLIHLLSNPPMIVNKDDELKFTERAIR